MARSKKRKQRRPVQRLSIVQEYLAVLVQTGLYGRTSDEVAYRFICEGIEKRLADRIIPRRAIYPSYETERHIR